MGIFLNRTLPGGSVPAEQLSDELEFYQIVSPDIIYHLGLRYLMLVFVCHFLLYLSLWSALQYRLEHVIWMGIATGQMTTETRAALKERKWELWVKKWGGGGLWKTERETEKEKMNNRISSRDQRLSPWPWSWVQGKLCQLPRIQAYKEESIFMTGRSGSTISPFLIWKLSILWWKLFPQEGLHRRSPAVAPVRESTFWT